MPDEIMKVETMLLTFSVLNGMHVFLAIVICKK